MAELITTLKKKLATTKTRDIVIVTFDCKVGSLIVTVKFNLSSLDVEY